jgi:hypothetical protein
MAEKRQNKAELKESENFGPGVTDRISNAASDLPARTLRKFNPVIRILTDLHAGQYLLAKNPRVAYNMYSRDNTNTGIGSGVPHV